MARKLERFVLQDDVPSPWAEKKRVKIELIVNELIFQRCKIIDVAVEFGDM